MVISVMKDKKARPLSAVRAGEKVRLKRIDAGQSLNARLASMGLVTNVEIMVVNNGHSGSFMIKVKESKMVLGRGIAHKIIVF